MSKILVLLSVFALAYSQLPSYISLCDLSNVLNVNECILNAGKTALPKIFQDAKLYGLDSILPLTNNNFTITVNGVRFAFNGTAYSTMELNGTEFNLVQGTWNFKFVGPIDVFVLDYKAYDSDTSTLLEAGKVNMTFGNITYKYSGNFKLPLILTGNFLKISSGNAVYDYTEYSYVLYDRTNTSNSTDRITQAFEGVEPIYKSEIAGKIGFNTLTTVMNSILKMISLDKLFLNLPSIIG